MSATLIPDGSIITITSGEYSSYGVVGVFRSVSEIDSDALREEFFVEHPDQRTPFRFSEYKFVAFLSEKGLIQKIDAWELWVGDEGFDLTSPEPPA